MDKRFGLYIDLMRSTQADAGETIAQRSKRSAGFGPAIGPPPERRSTISSMQGGYNCFNNTCANNNSNCSRMRNLSGGSVGSTTSGSSSGSCSNLVDNQFSSNNFSHLTFDPAFTNNSRTNNNTSMNNSNSSITSSSRLFSTSSSSPNSSHRNSRQERSGSFLSDNIGSSNSTSSSCERHGSTSSASSQQQQQQQSQRSVNSSRYKTELCRPFEESGSCKYGDKCQFAHGMHELRNLSRHPKYKTELCRTFHTIGYCPYGPRCHFIHEEEPGSGGGKNLPPEAGGLPSPKLAGSVQSSSSGSSSPSLSPSGCSSEGVNYNVFCYHQSEQRQQQAQDNRQLNNTLPANGNFNSSSSGSTFALDKQFSMMNLNRTRSQEERDIFSHITLFSEEELLDNACSPPPMSAARPSPFPESHQHLDNFPSFAESSYFRGNDDFLSCILGSLNGQNMENHHSLTGSSTDGSSSASDSGSSGGSDCGGSTENLNSSAFSDWRTPVAIGQY
ncbi:hypothetical protein EGW08_016945 [Elysia chlorotica]|uniref:C3H1-type domain-containing protein n=1 Tax=Elysia chlorotica TaxID=188477 RepID=A0A3S1HA83_ELYCH|nr:hypothetical protein EGW08_016945 [Elysia chlorotica]